MSSNIKRKNDDEQVNRETPKKQKKEEKLEILTKEIKKHTEKEKVESTKHKTIQIDDVPKGYGEFDYSICISDSTNRNVLRFS